MSAPDMGGAAEGADPGGNQILVFLPDVLAAGQILVVAGLASAALQDDVVDAQFAQPNGNRKPHRPAADDADGGVEGRGLQ